MAELFVRRPNTHLHIVGLIILMAMVVLFALLLDGHKPAF